MTVTVTRTLKGSVPVPVPVKRDKRFWTELTPGHPGVPCRLRVAGSLCITISQTMRIGVHNSSGEEYRAARYRIVLFL